MSLEKGKNFSLKPNLSLLNASFEGYKLKLYSDLDAISFLEQFNGFRQSESDVGYLHTKLVSLYNHIHPDPFNTLIGFIFDAEYKLHSFSLQQLNSPSKVYVCLKPEDDVTLSDLSLPPSINFPSASLALASNGFNKLLLYETGERTNTEWQKLLDIEMCNSIIAHSLLNEAADELNVLLVSIVNPDDLKKDDSLCNLDSVFGANKTCLSWHKVQWLTLGIKESNWSVTRRRILVGSGAIEFLALTQECDQVALLSKEVYHFVYDSMKDIIPVMKPQKVSKFIFQQCPKTVTIWINIRDINLEEVEVELKSSSMEVIRCGTSLFKRQFSNAVHTDSSSWKLGDGNLEVNLTKSEDGVWDLLFKDCNDNVEEIGVVDEARQEIINSAIERMMTEPEREKPPYNPDQLEDCDSNEEAILTYIDGETHTCAQFSILNTAQALFTTVLQSPSAPGFCMRHDVDGILWTLDGKSVPIHSATFNAFGYVKASKTMAKYTAVPSDNSYVAISDVKCHVYVFYQSRTIEGELRNRRSGALVPTYAQQLVITLKNRDEVMGIYAIKEGILVLNQDKVTFYSLPSND